MRKLKTISFLFFLSWLIQAAMPAGALVKFVNDSKEDFVEVKARIAGKEWLLKELKAGQTTPYIQMGKTFLTGYFQVITSRDTLIYSPSAEELLKQEEYSKGKFIFKLRIEVKEGKSMLAIKGEKK
jgi:hypothetical protein